MADSNLQLDLGLLSFYWRTLSKNQLNEASDISQFLPFTFGFEPEFNLITQRPYPQLFDILNQVYLRDSNIGSLQPGHALASAYGGELMDFILKSIKTFHPEARKVMDIGCGGCYILNELQQLNYQVFGVDPSPVTTRFAKEFNIPVATGFYPVEHSFGSMDIILSCGILEHVEDPCSFISSHQRDLNPDGLLIVFVPDSTPSIELGDISMVLHEHLSYFDQESLQHVLKGAGYEILNIEKAKYGAALYCVARPAKKSAGRAVNLDDSHSKFKKFIDKVQVNLEKIKSYIQTCHPEQIGFYVPIRALPYLSVLKCFKGVRLFDDNEGLHGRYFDGFEIAVENFEDLIKQPVQHLIIMSPPHGKAIEKKIRSVLGDSLSVICLDQIFEA